MDLCLEAIICTVAHGLKLYLLGPGVFVRELPYFGSHLVLDEACCLNFLVWDVCFKIILS